MSINVILNYETSLYYFVKELCKIFYNTLESILTMRDGKGK